MKIIAILLACILVLSFIPNQSFAKSVKDTLTYQVIWVTGNKSCYQNDHNRLQEYDALTARYLSAYGISAFYYDPICITEEAYKTYQAPQYTDLLIVVYNQNIGREILHERNMGGFFQWRDTDMKNALKIEVCECAAFDYNDWPWVLSHELAHFALFYLGYSYEDFVGWVHQVQKMYYEYCPDGDVREPVCSGLYMRLEGPNRTYQVMTIPKEALSAIPPQQKFLNADTDEPIIKKTKSKDKKTVKEKSPVTKTSSKNTVKISKNSFSNTDCGSKCFVPNNVKISTGQTVTWKNSDSQPHTVFSGDPKDGPDGKFESKLIEPNKAFSKKFTKKGTFDYFCLIHPWMQGKVTVK